MRLISSRESFARFAVPYGPDAIAFAASTSRHDLEPTPDYEPAPGAVTAARSSPLVPAELSVDAVQPSSDPPPRQALLGDNAEAHKNPETHSEEPLASPVKEAYSTAIPSPVVNVEVSPSPMQTPPVSEPVSQDADVEAFEAAPTTSLSPPPPPTSFKVVPPPPRMRPESRASSVMSTTSFATAEESLYASAPSGTDSPDSPSTPHITSFHPHDITDTTISHGIPVTV